MALRPRVATMLAPTAGDPSKKLGRSVSGVSSVVRKNRLRRRGGASLCGIRVHTVSRSYARPLRSPLCAPGFSLPVMSQLMSQRLRQRVRPDEKAATVIEGGREAAGDSFEGRAG